MEICEDIRHTIEMKELYSKRTESIEWLFGTAKKPWISIYKTKRESVNGNERRSYLCLHEFREISRNEATKGDSKGFVN